MELTMNMGKHNTSKNPTVKAREKGNKWKKGRRRLNKTKVI